MNRQYIVIDRSALVPRIKYLLANNIQVTIVNTHLIHIIDVANIIWEGCENYINAVRENSIQAADSGILGRLPEREDDVFVSFDDLEEYLWRFSHSAKEAKEILFSFNLEHFKDNLVIQRVKPLKERIAGKRARMSDLQAEIDDDLALLDMLTDPVSHRSVPADEARPFMEWIETVNSEPLTINVET